MKIVLSSYEEKGNDSLYLYDINIERNKATKMDQVKLNQPSFVISFKKNEVNYVVTYTKNPITLILYKVINDKFVCVDEYKLPYPFTTLTHLYYLDEIERLYACSYKDGAYLKIDIIGDKFENYFARENYKPSLCHHIFYNYDKKEICIVDIKNDTINVYDEELNYVKTFKINSACGPRHALYKNEKIYLITEYSNEVYVIDYNSGKTIQHISTLKEDCKSFGATLFFIDEYLLASNRGEETIAAFKEKDLLEYQYSIPVYGKNSRHMIKSKDNSYIMTCNMDSSELVIIDMKTGENILSIPCSKVSCAAEL